MDTRQKILTPEAALRLGPGLTLVTGYFDALRAAHLPELARLPRPVLALVLPREDELVAQAARAEMAAALRIIDYVAMADERETAMLIERLAPGQVVRLEARDEALVRQLIEHVQQRHNR